MHQASQQQSGVTASSPGVKIIALVGYEKAVLAIPRCFPRIALRTLRAVPRFPPVLKVLGELRDGIKHIERLATFAAEELPEVVYQLEKIREQLAAIERNLGRPNQAEPEGRTDSGRTVTRDERRTGSRRPS
jgi:hypothetical protein